MTKQKMKDFLNQDGRYQHFDKFEELGFDLKTIGALAQNTYSEITMNDVADAKKRLERLFVEIQESFNEMACDIDLYKVLEKDIKDGRGKEQINL